MQRNVRMVLILVDGQSTVADLSIKTGNSQLTENALHELEKTGFVELLEKQDSLWAESIKIAHEIRTAALNKVIQIASPEAKDVLEPSVPDEPLSIHSAFQTPAKSDSSLSQFSVAHMQSLRVTREKPPPVLAQESTKKFAAQQPESADEPKLSFAQRIKALIGSAGRRNGSALLVEPPGGVKGNSIGWPVIVVFGVSGALALAFLMLVFFPYERYLPELKIAFEQACGRPVKVGTMRVNIYPDPGLLLGDVRIGVGQQEIRIETINLQPVLGTLIGAKKIFREVTLSGVSLPAEVISALPSVFAAMAGKGSRVGVEHIRFENTDISFGGLGFSGMEGEAKLSADGSFQALLLRSQDRSLTLEAKPLAQGLDVALEAFGWRPVSGSPFIFDSANIKGSLENGALTVTRMELRIFDGLVQGTAVLRADKKPSASGEIVFERINSTRFGDALGIGPQFSGETSGKLRFSTAADSWASIFSAIEADGEFAMQRGSFRGIDLIEAVRRLSGSPVQGGSTVFENLSGRINLTPTNSQFRGLVLNSGLMQSTGQIEVSKGLKVSGKMELEMRGTVNQTRIPVFIGGRLDSPTVQAGKNR